jgi:hypothetical protein
VCVFYADQKSKMATTTGYRLTLVMSCGGVHLEFSIGIKKQKLCRGPSNDHSWAVWFQLSKWFQRRSVFKHFSYRENVLKRFFSETTWTIETKLPRNDHWKVLYKVSVFLCRSKIQDGRHRRT